MPWHVYAQIGPADEFTPEIPKDEPRLPIAIDKSGSPFEVASGLVDKVLRAGLAPLPATIDLLNIATVIFATDLRVSRSYIQDQWTRELILYLPVSEPDLWEGARDTLVELASFLTGDVWQIRFRPSASVEYAKRSEKTAEPVSSVCLFSGGLDSYVGAIDILSTGERVALVGHYSTKRDQEAAFNTLVPEHAAQLLPLWFHVLPPLIHADHVGESTMRSRSILFLALGSLVASALPGDPRLIVPENGLISLNVPLTFGRGGSHSTRTTHPHTIALYRRLLEILGISTTIELPYRFVTKGEMLRDVKNPALLRIGIHQTMSCAHPVAGRYLKLPVGHCGYCVPCIIRRAALHAANLDDESRQVDILARGITLSSAARADKRAFEMAISRLKPMTRFERAAEIQNSGPIAPDDINGALRVFDSGMQEIERFLNSCPGTGR